LGAAAQTLDETLQGVRERRQFGRPLSRVRGVAFPPAGAATRIEPGDGTPQIQKLVIARHLLGREFAPET